jgi:hypothetical protein
MNTLSSEFQPFDLRKDSGMIQHLPMPRCAVAFCLFAAFLLGNAFAQTVTVDKSLATTDTTHFKSLRAAIMSFDWVSSTTTGFNAGNAEPNVINITGFGPYDEDIPMLYTSASFTADYKCKLDAADVTITLQGSGIKPLLLVRFISYDQSGIAVLNSAAYVIRNTVIAPSPTEPPTGRLVHCLGTGIIDIQDSTLCCLPVASTAYTSIADLPAGVLDGTLAFNDSYVSCVTPGATTGMAAQASGLGTVRFTNSCITQFGVAATAGVSLCAFQSGTIRLNEGTILRNNTGGIYTRHNDATNKSRLIISGQKNNRVIIGKNNPWGNGWLDLRLFSQVDISQCNFIGEPTGYAVSVGTNGATLGSLKISECIFAEGNPATTTSAIRVAGVPATLALDNLTILNQGLGVYYSGTAAASINIIDSIIAGCTYGLAGAAAFNVAYCALPDSGASANTNTSRGDATLNLGNTIYDDPMFTSEVFGTTGFAHVTNLSYSGKASTSRVLDGGGTADSINAAKREWALY